MENGTFNLADKIKFDGTNCIFDFSGNDIVKNEELNDAKKELREDYQNSIVTVNNQGIDIKDGKFTVTNSNSQVVIDGKYNIHKIITTGIIDCTCHPNEGNRSFYIYHNFGYIPHATAEQMMNNNGESVPLPAFSISGIGDTSTYLSFDTMIRLKVTSERLEINVLRSGYAYNSTQIIKVRYWIYQEVAF